MDTPIFIPKKIRVGYQKRTDTFTNMLAYVIYFDAKNKLCKEKSWQRWRDKTIDPNDYDNVPTEGFVLNKNIKRGGWSWHSTNSSHIRIYDPRGFEFEISPTNLIGILMHVDCNKRVLDGKFVYAFHGGDLILVPENSEQYTKSMEFTSLKTQNLKKKELKEGATYKGKDTLEYVYLGERAVWESNYEGKRYKSKYVFGPVSYHVFYCIQNNQYYKEKNISKYSHLISTDVVANYNTIVDEFIKNHVTSKIVSIREEELSDEELKTRHYSYVYVRYTDNKGNRLLARCYYYYMNNYTYYTYNTNNNNSNNNWVIPASSEIINAPMDVLDLQRTKLYTQQKLHQPDVSNIKIVRLIGITETGTEHDIKKLVY